MAPEVALNETYSLGADVYSIGIVLWKILALEFTFAILSIQQHHDQVLLWTDSLPFPRHGARPCRLCSTSHGRRIH